MRAPRFVAIASLLLATSRAGAAFAADKDPAELAFDRGIEHMQAGRFAEGCPLIEQSYTLDPRPGTLFALADCEVQNGRLATADARYDEYLRMYEALPREKKLKQGTRERDARAVKAR